MLKNERYRGLWEYGKTEAVLLPSKDYIRQVKRSEPLKSIEFEELRIISDQVFFQAQKRLAKLKADCGRKPSDGDRQSRPKLLNGLFWCPCHQRALYVGGSQGQYMLCKGCSRESRDTRALYTQLNRKFALEKICNALAELIQADDQLVEQIIQTCQQEAGRLQQPDPAQLEQLKKRKESLRRSMGILMRQEPQTDTEEQELEFALREKRSEMAEVQFQLATLAEAEQTQIKIPTAAEVQAMLAELSGTLLQIVETGPPAETDEIRELLTRLTSGKIELFQMGEKRPQQGWLQGRFQTPLISVLLEKLTGMPCDHQHAKGYQEVIVDFHIQDRDNEKVKQAWQLYQQGKLKKDIADILSCSRSNVTRLLKKAAIAFGQPLEDGRQRRATLEKKQQKTPQYHQLAEEAVQLWKQGDSHLKIGRKLGCSDMTAKKAIRHWYESNHLPVPTIKSRRADQQAKARQLYNEQLPLNKIAAMSAREHDL